eukprot:TRINITY_DN49302_c0_g1_i1.p1 TRINITY_DN49302_c0_g1~~TRINITY_DN49302_c0_g1_i1.p1  ORF type:complete len:672 (-),score=142.13 TRINITY_DN49302_c0_g1_i1:49-2016(-)
MSWAPGTSSLLATWCRWEPARSKEAATCRSAVRLWVLGAAEPHEVRLEHGESQVCHAAWSPSTQHLQLAVMLNSGKAMLWSVRVEKPDVGVAADLMLELQHSSAGAPCAALDSYHAMWSPDGTFLVASASQGGARLCGAQPDGDLVFEVNQGIGDLDKAQWSLGASSRRVASSMLAAWPEPKVWKVLKGGNRTPISLTSPEVQDALQALVVVRSWSPDSERLVTVAHSLKALEARVKSSQLFIWSWKDLRFIPQTIDALSGRDVHEIAWSPDSVWLLAACADGTVRLFDAQRAELVWMIGDEWNIRRDGDTCWPKGAISARFLPCGHRIAVTTRSRDVGGEPTDGDSVIVVGPHFYASEYRRLLENRSEEADLPGRPDISVESILRLLEALGQHCGDGEHAGLRSFSASISAWVSAKWREWVSTGSNFQELPSYREQLSSLEQARLDAQLQAAALWSCPEEVIFQGANRTLCWLVNYAVAADDPDLLNACLHFILSFHRFCTLLRSPLLPPVVWPSEDKAGLLCTWRGGIFFEAWRPFFVEGTLYRLPGYVNTCLDRNIARCYAETEVELDSLQAAVEWCFEFSCAEGASALYLDAPFCAGGGGDFIFSPNSVVEIVRVRWAGVAENDSKLHQITLRLRGEPGQQHMDLPVGPWR